MATPTTAARPPSHQLPPPIASLEGAQRRQIRLVLPEMEGYFYKVRGGGGQKQGKGHFDGLMGDPRLVTCEALMPYILRAIAAVGRSLQPRLLDEYRSSIKKNAELTNQWQQAWAHLSTTHGLSSSDAEHALYILAPLVYSSPAVSPNPAPPPPAWADSPCMLVDDGQQDQLQEQGGSRSSVDGSG